ncbi:MAG: phospholipase, partial [Actinomycetota bacterium]|nr:phospholipase [Actinomycetota bacterium]
AYSEHPNWQPDYGSWYVSQVIDILASHPEVWSKMALFVTYDEDGGFFDHQVSPTPPQTRAQGLSTVATTNEIFPGDAGHPAGPYGLGLRVPMVVVSPWTRGGWVNSQLFDHTSLIRFLEARFGDRRADLVESNITPWRRAVVGDLTTAFDFKTPNASRVSLPSTDDFRPVDLVRHPDEVPVPPADQRLPGQERGVRPARPIPYTLHADGHASDASFIIDFRSSGRAAAVFHVRSAGSTDDPRSYTVEPGKHLSDTWDVGSGYDLAVYGPNGFFRGFKGASSAGQYANLDVKASYDERHNEIELEIRNRGSERAKVTVRNGYTADGTKLSLKAGEAKTERWSLSRTRGWYDLVITVEGDPHFEYRYAGHLENGEASISDPAMGGLI